jgi:cell division protein FtsQ
MRRASDRTEERQRSKARPNRKRRNYLPFVLSVACAGLAAEGVYAALTSPRFAVGNVEVRGAEQVPMAAILKAAAIPIHSNLFRLKNKGALERVAQIPRIRHVRIHRRLPNRVLVEVVERKPVALLAAGLNYYLVDDSGVPYAMLKGNGVKLPVFRVDPAPTIRLGEPLKNAAFQVGLKSLFVVKASLAGAGALWVDRDLNLCLNRGDFSARLGQPEDLARKLKLFKGLLNADSNLSKKAQYIDLSVPDHPALMPRQTAVASDSNHLQTAGLSGGEYTLPSQR